MQNVLEDLAVKKFERVENEFKEPQLYEQEVIKRFLIEQLSNKAESTYILLTLDKESKIQSMFKKTGETSTIEIFKTAILDEAAEIVVGCNCSGSYNVIDEGSKEMLFAENVDVTGLMLAIPVLNHFIVNEAYTFSFQEFDLNGTLN